MDIKAYLAEQGLTPEEITALVGNEKTAKAMSSALAKYDEGMAAATEAQTKLEAANRTNAETQDFWEKKVTPALTGADKKVATASARAAQLQAYLSSLKDQGYDVPDELLKASGEPTHPNPTNPEPTNSSYLTRDDFRKEMSGTAPTLVSLMSLSNEYVDLFGSPYLAGESDFAEAQKARKPLREYVREKYKFDAKRDEKKNAAEQKRIDEIVAEKVKTKEAELQQRYGSNGNISAPMASKFDKIEKIAERKDSWKSSAGRDNARKDRLDRFKNVVM